MSLEIGQIVDNSDLATVHTIVAEDGWAIRVISELFFGERIRGGGGWKSQVAICLLWHTGTDTTRGAIGPFFVEGDPYDPL